MTITCSMGAISGFKLHTLLYALLMITTENNYKSEKCTINKGVFLVISSVMRATAL